MASDQEPPTLLLPPIKHEIAPAENVVFEWKHLLEAKQYAFAIRDLQTKEFIYNSKPFLRLEADDICTDDKCTLSSPDTAVMNDYGRYVWRVVAFDKDKKRISASRRVLFVSGEAPSIPVIDAPLHDSIHELGTQPSFQWKTSEGAKHYIFRLVDITDKSERKLIDRQKVLLTSCAEDSCAYELPERLAVGTYRLVVRASNGYDLSKSEVIRFTVTPTLGTIVDGYDWSLPEYAANNSQGGLIRDEWPNNAKPEDYTNTAFYSLRWSDVRYKKPKESGGFEDCLVDESANQGCIYDFGDFNWWMGSPGGIGNNVLVRLEVNSVCDVPERLRGGFNYYAGGSIAFWERPYIDALGELVSAFGNQFADNERIIGVHLGIADGEYEQIEAYLDAGGSYDNFYEEFCPNSDKETFNYYSGDDGWGEFWVDEIQLQHAQIKGLNPEIFEASVEEIINIYTQAFTTELGSFTSKLAMTNLGNFVYNDPDLAIVSDDEIQVFNDIKMNIITPEALTKGVGSRDGLIEDWMAYNNPIYGTGFKPGPNQSCYMTMDETFAERYSDRYSGTENEEYGDEDWVSKKYGAYEGQPYRFMMSSLRALQMRRNHIQLNTDAMFDMTLGDAPLENDLKTVNFLSYLASTVGRDKTETPDAFVVLGERYIRPISEYVYGYSDEDFASEALETCLVKDKYGNTSHVQVREFGRWLTEVSGKGTKSNLVDLDMGNVDEETSVRIGTEPWSIPRYLPEVTAEDGKVTKKYEYSARSSNEFQFDINDTVVANRCESGAVCNLEVKVVFQDTVATTLSLVTEAGVVGAIETDGLAGTKTVTFNVEGTFNNGLENGADFKIVTSYVALPVFMTRVHFLNEPASETPVLAVVAAEPN
jgi:hypothetical protein